MALLEYENQIFLDAFQEDGLLVMAKYVNFMWCDYVALFVFISVK